MHRFRHLLLAFGLLACAALAQAQAPVKIEPIRASERVYYVQGSGGMASRANAAFNSNAAFVVTDDAWSCSMRSAAPRSAHNSGRRSRA